MLFFLLQQNSSNKINREKIQEYKISKMSFTIMLKRLRHIIFQVITKTLRSSNALTAAFPRNISNFIIQLTKSRIFPFHVELVELQYLHSWNTLTSDACFEMTKENKRGDFALRSRPYASLPENMNQLILDAKDGPKISLQYDPLIQKNES